MAQDRPLLNHTITMKFGVMTIFRSKHQNNNINALARIGCTA